MGNSTGSLGRELQALAMHALDLNQLTKLAKAIGKARSEGQVSESADAVPAGGAEQLDNRYDRAGAGGERRAAWHSA